MKKLNFDDNCKFILIGSHYCLEKISQENRDFFENIHPVSRSFHRIDEGEVETILLKYLDLYGAENIRLLTNEDSTQMVCANLREKHRIPGIKTEQILPFVNKVFSKNKLSGKIKTPNFILFNKLDYQSNPRKYLDSIVKDIGFPMFIKPVDLVSSIGTHHIKDYNTLKRVTAKIILDPWEFEIDQFIDGYLFHCDLIVQNSNIEFFMAGKYAYPLAQFSKGHPMGSIPVNDQTLFVELQNFSSKILSHLGMFSSAFHLEIFQEKKSGELIFLEAAARTPGALVPNMYDIIFNKNIEELHYLVQMNTDYHVNITKTENHAGWITFPQIKGTLIDIKKPKMSINNTITTCVEPGDVLQQAQSLLDSSCSVFFWDKSYQKIEQYFEFLKKYEPLVF